jgi:predicted dehydrogenase
MARSRRTATRRKFLGTAAVTGAGLMIVPRHVLGRGMQAPSDTLAIAGIGCGGKGTSDLQGVASERIVALCDIDFRHASSSVAAFPDAKRYVDFRVMLDEQPGIDAVTVSTPDHTHAVIALEAMRRGKHVFCQKPLTRTIQECQKLMAVARETKVATQMGNQGHAMDHTPQIREMLEAGLIGTVREVDFWTNRPIWPQGLLRPTELHHVPEHVHWDLWLGPVKERPYHPRYYHPFNWRGWWDFGTGALGDIACHSMDAAFWTYDLREPASITAETTPLYPESAPASSRIVYEFPARGGRGPITAVWRDGSIQPPRPEAFDGEIWPGMSSGQLFVGDKGILVAGIYGEQPRLYPRSLQEAVEQEPPPEKYPRSKGIFDEWIGACKGEGTASSSFVEHSGPLTEMALLGNLAVRTGETIRWDGQKGTAGSAAADALLGDEYRPGWSL